MVKTRDEYMTALAMGLKDIDHQVVKDLLNEMDQYFKDGLSQGKSEAQLCEALGDVDEFIQEFKAMDGQGKTKHEVVVSNTSDTTIDIDNANVTIKMGPSFACNYDASVYEMISDMDGNDRHIRFRSIRKSTISINVVNGLINFLSSGHQIEIVVPGSIPSLGVTTVNGDIYGDGLTIDHLRISSDRGDIEIKKARGLTMECNSEAGDIELSDCEYDTIYFDTNMGDVTIGCNGQIIQGQTDLGDIDINGSVDTIDIKTSKGDIEFKGYIHADSKMTTGLGDIFITTTDVRVKAKSGLGDIYVEGDSYNGYNQLGSGSSTLSLQTSAGDITVDPLD